MANEKNDKKLVLTIIGSCVAAILIFHFAWTKQLLISYRNPLFSFGDGAIISLFVYESIRAYRFEDDYTKDWLRKFIIWVAVFSCCWAGGWAAGVNEKKMMEQDFEKGRESSEIYCQPSNDRL